MPYNNNERMIVAPVSIRDVQIATGCGDNDLGTLIANANINMWAKWKPIKAPVIGLMTSEIMRTTAGVYRYGIKRNAGSIPLWNPSTGELTHDVWTYDRPTGGSSSPYRLADFANWDAHANPGYYHNAPCPVRVAFPDPYEIADVANREMADNVKEFNQTCCTCFSNFITVTRTGYISHLKTAS